MAKKIIIGNWKENPSTIPQAIALFKAVSAIRPPRGFDLVVCPPLLYLEKIAEQYHRMKFKTLSLGAQDVFWEDGGAHTSEIGPGMLKRLGLRYVIIGHSERRRELHETDAMINKKIKAAFKEKLNVILCVGEPAHIRVKGIKAAEKYVAGQLKKDLRGIAKELKMDSRLPTYGISGETKSGSDRKKRFALRSPFINLLIAYEPVWAIGTGKNDSPADARAMAVFIKKEVDRLLPLSTTRDPLRVLYGGSVHGKNAHDYLSLKEISGALVGGASLKADEFRKIVNSLKNSLTS